MSNYLQVGGFAGGNSNDSVKQLRVYKLTAYNITSKSLTLDFMPASPQNVMLMPAGSAIQIFGEDYTITENVLSWDTLGLDGVLDDTDTLFIYY
jgi:hypothetical protein